MTSNARSATRIRRTRAKPEAFGMMSSVITRLKVLASRAAQAASPSPAVLTS